MKRLLLIVAALCCVVATAWALDPALYNITMQAGEDYRLTLVLKDAAGAVQNITGCSYRAQYRSSYAPAGTVYATYSAIVTAPATGTVSVRLSRAQTGALSGTSGVWDLQQTDSGGAVSYLMKGSATVAPTVTR